MGTMVTNFSLYVKGTSAAKVPGDPIGGVRSWLCGGNANYFSLSWQFESKRGSQLSAQSIGGLVASVIGRAKEGGYPQALGLHLEDQGKRPRQGRGGLEYSPLLITLVGVSLIGSFPARIASVPI
jgi:hypothetical protein